MTSRNDQLVHNIRQLASGEPMTILPDVIWVDGAIDASKMMVGFTITADDHPIIIPHIRVDQPSLFIQLQDENGEFKTVARVTYEMVAIYLGLFKLQKVAAFKLGWNRNTLGTYLKKRREENVNA